MRVISSASAYTHNNAIPSYTRSDNNTGLCPVRNGDTTSHSYPACY